MNAFPPSLTRFTPPLWAIVGVAALMAAGLLSAFVDTLQDHIRHSAELRRAQGTVASRPIHLAAATEAQGAAQPVPALAQAKR